MKNTNNRFWCFEWRRVRMGRWTMADKKNFRTLFETVWAIYLKAAGTAFFMSESSSL